MAKNPTKNKPASTKQPRSQNTGAGSTHHNLGGATRAARVSTHIDAMNRGILRGKMLLSRKRYYEARKRDARNLPLNTLTQQSCFPSTQIYGVKGDNNKWICSTLNQLTWREKNHAVQEHEVRIFIEGAEVSSYLRDSLSWTLNGTDGMNTCSFTLNNNHDAFIITPANVCSHLDLHGWRVPLTKKRQLITSPSRSTRNTDEVAKYIIYRNKARRVFPPHGHRNSSNPQIDPDSGMWLYPLSPFSPVIHKHDCVRVFYRLPHITGVGKNFARKYGGKKTKVTRYAEAWAPAFTGYIDEYDFEDDPVSGDRKMNIRCYDFKGLLERMRVRVLANPTNVRSGKKDSDTMGAMAAQKKKAKTAKKDAYTGLNHDLRFIQITDKLGINAEIKQMFNTILRTQYSAVCFKSGKYDLKCTANLYQQLHDKTKDQIRQLRDQWVGTPATKTKEKTKGLDPAVQAANKNDGRKRTYERESNGRIKINISGGAGVEEAKKVIPKAVKFLQSTCKDIPLWATQYASAYGDVWPLKAKLGLPGNAPYPKDALSKPEARAGSDMQAKNAHDLVKSIDTRLKSEQPVLYTNAGIGKTTYSKTDRVFLLNQYAVTTVLGFFKGVSKKVLAAINEYVAKSTGGSGLLPGKTVAVFGRVVTAKTVVVFTAPATAAAVADGLLAYASGTALTKGSAKNNGGNQVAQAAQHEAAITSLLETFNKSLDTLRADLNSVLAKAQAEFSKNPDALRAAKAGQIARTYEALASSSANTKVKQGADTLADILHTDAKFDFIKFGIYRDLSRALDKDKHPLAGMGYEEATTWLCTANSYINVGLLTQVDKYEPSVLQLWNMRMVFGIMGRAYTYREVSEFGRQCVTESDRAKAPLSPLHSFMHLLVPKDGTGAQTLIQQESTKTGSTSQRFEYESRLSLLNKISKTLDYQFFVTPIGDIAFEFPHYSGLPYDFGKVFQGAYTVTKGLRSFRCTEETGECNTGWVLTGMENEKLLEAATNGVVVENKYKKQVIIADVLARRIGVKVRHLKVELPGIGSVFNGSVQMGLSSILAYGLLEIQREMGRMSQISVQHEFRPYMLINRPIHVVHRQRMALTKSVTYSMSPPMGECTVSSELQYVRKLHPDGSFHHIAGGTRQPVDYTGLFTGDVKQTVKYGSSPQDASRPDVFIESAKVRNAVLQTQGRRNPKDRTPLSCGPYLKDRYIESAWSYSDQIGAQYNKAEKYTKYTSGSAGLPSELPPLSSYGRSYLASGAWRPADNTGDPLAAVDTRNTGYSTGEGNKDKDNKRKSGYIGILFNPWAYGIMSKKNGSYPNRFNQWGFFRIITPEGKPSKNRNPAFKNPWGRKHKGKRSWHNGIDFNGGVTKGTPAYTPIALNNIRAVLHVKRSKGGFDTEWVTVSGGFGKKILDTVKKFALKKNGKYITRPVPGAAGIVQYLVSKTAYSLYLKLKEQAAKKGDYSGKHWTVQISYDSGEAGLHIYGDGVAAMPGSPSQKVACRLHYIHTDRPAVNGRNVLYGSVNNRKEDNAAAADTVVAHVGTTGTSNVHLHFEMSVWPPGKAPKGARGQTDRSAWKEVLKANTDFLRTQMRMKLTAGKGLNSGVFSDDWKAYFDKVNKKRGFNITTVDQATEYMLKNRSIGGVLAEKFKSNSTGSSGSVVTNPLFFFRPEQIIKDLTNEYNAYRKTWGDTFFTAKPDGKGAGVCGNSSAAVQQKISLAYSACLGNSRKLTGRKKKNARKECRAVRDNTKKGTSVKIKPRGTTPAEKVARKQDAAVKRSVASRNSKVRTGKA